MSNCNNLRAPNIRWHFTTRNTAGVRLSSTALTIQKLTMAYNNLATKNWFHSLPSQRFQALLTLFPKSFSSFPHGTCLLSVSGLYLALEENYLPFCAPLPKYATLRSHAGKTKPTTWTGFSPSLMLSSKKTYAEDRPSNSPQDYNSETRSRIYNLSSSRFSRPY